VRRIPVPLEGMLELEKENEVARKKPIPAAAA